MIRGYVSSDEDDYDDYDFGYSESLVIERKEPPSLPEIQLPEVKDKLYSALKESEKRQLFFKKGELGDVAALEELISEGVSVDCIDDQRWTLLIKACGTGNVDVVRFLLEAGADPNKNRDLLTPLITCCTHTYIGEDVKLNCVRLLLQYGAEVNAKDKYRTTALMCATESGYEDIVTELLGVPGIDVNTQDKEGWTALFYAVKNNNLKLVKKLISAGTNLNLKDRQERSVMHLALDKDLMDLAKILGYVEEKNEKPKKRKTLRKKFLSKLPDLNGQGGFSSDAKVILCAFNQFNVQPITLPDFLNATEKDLHKIGVILKPDRRKILQKGIHSYHLYPWKASSMPQITQGVPIRLEETIAITGALAKHLTIANASLKYLDTRISLRQNKALIDLAVQKEMIITLINAYQSAEKIKIILPKILDQIKQIKPEISDDYMYLPKKEKNNRRARVLAIFFYALGGVTAAAIASHFLCNNISSGTKYLKC